LLSEKEVGFIAELAKLEANSTEVVDVVENNQSL
jgi:hypothetical protein